MIRLFLKFFLLIILILYATKWSFEAILARQQFSDRERVITKVHLGGMHLIANELNLAPEDRVEALLEKIRLQFRAPLEVRPLIELPPDQQRKLKLLRGHFYEFQNTDKEHLGVSLDAQHYLRLGPFTDYSVFEFEDSLWGWLRLLALKVDKSDQSQQALDELSGEFGLPLLIQSTEELPKTAIDRLEIGREVVFFGQQNAFYAATLLDDTAKCLRVGPLPAFQDVTKRASSTTLTGSLLISAILIGGLVANLSRKFRRIENVAGSFSRGNLAARVDVSKSGEAKQLAIAFNAMAAKTEKMIRSRRELLQMVSHELRTPLARLRFAADLIDANSADAKTNRRMAIIQHSIDDLDTIVSEILEYVQNKEELDLRSQEWVDVRRTIEPLSLALTEETPHLKLEFLPSDPDQSPMIFADRIAFVRVAKNLIGNAQRYAKSTLRIRAYDTPHPSDPSKTRTCVEFDDDGPGIPESKWQEVLEPFVRLSETGQSRSLPGQLDRSSNQSTPINYAGIGLGLAIVNRILKQHNGSLEIAQSPLGGCSVRTFWPCPKDRIA